MRVETPDGAVELTDGINVDTTSGGHIAEIEILGKSIRESVPCIQGLHVSDLCQGNDDVDIAVQDLVRRVHYGAQTPTHLLDCTVKNDLAPRSIVVQCHWEDHIMNKIFTALIQREDDMYVALCTDLDIASQGASIVEARENLKEAVELFLEEASEVEVAQRIHTEQYISNIEVAFAEA